MNSSSVFVPEMSSLVAMNTGAVVFVVDDDVSMRESLELLLFSPERRVGGVWNG